jgi:hypothetical protein
MNQRKGRQTMEQHVTVVGALHIGLAALTLLAAAIVFTAVVGGGLISGDPEAIRITAIVGAAISSFLAVLSVPGIVGGIGLLKRRSWARILVLIVAVLDLFFIPIGTLLGVYTIWVLMQDETAQLFS